VAGAPAIEQLAGRAISSHAIVQVGRQAPNFALSSLTGDVITEASFATREATLVLFWNPSCGFCQRMQPRLHQWQAQRANGEPPMLIISTGDAAALAGLESLGCPVLLDDGLLTSRFGATGTPMAVVVDSAGVLRSDIAAGEQAILDLLDPLATAHRTALPILTGGVS
jgi:thiol-disulfide isomerase/thioredoxin